MENLLKVKENDADRDENGESKSGMINRKKNEEKEVDNLHSDKVKDILQSSDVSIPKKNPSISLPKSLPIPKNVPSITSITSKPTPMPVTKERKGEEKATLETMNLNTFSARSPLITAKIESETVGSKVGESSVSRLKEEEGKEGKDTEVERDNLEKSTLTSQPNSLSASMILMCIHLHPVHHKRFFFSSLSASLLHSLIFTLSLSLSTYFILTLPRSILLPLNFSISFSLLSFQFLLTVYTFIPISISLFFYAQIDNVVFTL